MEKEDERIKEKEGRIHNLRELQKQKMMFFMFLLVIPHLIVYYLPL